MRIIKEGYQRVLYQVKIRNRFVTVATLQEQLFSLTKYKLIFSYYGRNTVFTIYQKDLELYDEMVERVAKMVKKRLYLIANEILTSIKEPTGAERSEE